MWSPQQQVPHFVVIHQKQSSWAIFYFLLTEPIKISYKPADPHDLVDCTGDIYKVLYKDSSFNCILVKNIVTMDQFLVILSTNFLEPKQCMNNTDTVTDFDPDEPLVSSGYLPFSLLIYHLCCFYVISSYVVC